ADDVGEQRAGRVTAKVQRLAADLRAHVRGEDRAAVRRVDLSALDRERRDQLDVVVLACGEARVRPRLPVRHAGDQCGEQHERGAAEVRDRFVQRSISRFARFETSSSPASRRKFATTLEPPYETSGSVMPVSGITRRTPPTMMNVCRAKPNVRPAASSFENPSSARSAMRMPRSTKIM